MLAKLWAGPHDGLEIEVNPQSALLRMPVSADYRAMSKPVTDVPTVVAVVARYLRIEDTDKYLYAGQEPM